MDYFFKKTGRMIWLQKGFYLLLLIQTAAGVYLFSYCLNTTMSCDDTVRRIDEGIGTDAIQLTCYLTGTNFQPDGFPVTPGQMARLRENEGTKGLGVQYLPYVRGTADFAGGGESRTIYLLFADEESGAFLGFDGIPEQGCIGSRAADVLRRWETEGQQSAVRQEETAFGLSSLMFFENQIVYKEEWNCPLDCLQPMRADLEERVVSGSYDNVSADNQILLTDCIVLPLERMGALAEAKGLNGKVSVQFFTEGWDGDFRIFADFVRELNAAGTDYHFSLTQQSVELHNSAEDIMIPYRESLWVGVSVLAITTSGMIGAFILILHRREKTNAVSVACGATYGRLFAELLAEAGSVIMAGTLAGLIASVPSVLNVHISALSMIGTMHAEAVLGCLGIGVLSAFVICAAAVLLVRRRQPAEVLKEA